VVEALRALHAGDVERLSRVIGPHTRIVVDTGAEPRRYCRALSWELRSMNGGPGPVGADRARRSSSPSFAGSWAT
jgi:hypothetical protein